MPTKKRKSEPPNTTLIEKTSKKPKKPLNSTQIVALIGLIASIIGICTFTSGVQSIPDLLARLGLAPKRPPSRPAASLEPPLQALRKGTNVFTMSFLEDFVLEINFKLGQVVDKNAPIDLIIANCEPASYIIFCDIVGKHIQYVGLMDLRNVTDAPLTNINVIEHEALEEGRTYSLYSYTNHPVKFRIKALEITYERNYPVFGSLLIEYVYQTNERNDFLEP